MIMSDNISNIVYPGGQNVARRFTSQNAVTIQAASGYNPTVYDPANVDSHNRHETSCVESAYNKYPASLLSTFREVVIAEGTATIQSIDGVIVLDMEGSTSFPCRETDTHVYIRVSVPSWTDGAPTPQNAPIIIVATMEELNLTPVDGFLSLGIIKLHGGF